jgi:hypothetical protein
MTAPSRKDVDAMANILKALNGNSSGVKAEAEATRSAQAASGEIDLTPGIGATDIKAMENILKSFHGASQNVASKVATTINESKRTQTGVDIGLYSVEKNADEYYDIRDNRTNDTLFEDVRLYETAFILAKHLNEGKKINSPEITKIISSNAIFEQYYHDAIQHKRTYNTAKTRGDFAKMDIAEARFDKAKQDASITKRHIKSIYESLNK